MYWFGKFFGAISGYLMGGPFGLLAGLFLGHVFDKGVANQQSTRRSHAQEAFFRAAFQVLGHVAKADGRVSEVEIQSADRLMQQLGIIGEQRKAAIRYFNEGKLPSFNLQGTLHHLLQACYYRQDLLRIFAEIQFQATMVDGGAPSQAQQHIIQLIFQTLGFSPPEFTYDYGPYYSNQRQRYQSQQRPEPLAAAYQTLGVTQPASQQEVKSAYRKLMSQHHPDKLIAKGLPPEMVKLATEKTQQIRAAYEQIIESGVH